MTVHAVRQPRKTISCCYVLARIIVMFWLHAGNAYFEFIPTLNFILSEMNYPPPRAPNKNALIARINTGSLLEYNRSFIPWWLPNSESGTEK
jgi:hypothetical protein